MATNIPANNFQALLNSLSGHYARVGQGRSLEEILQSYGPLSGVESQRLRSYFTSHGLNPARDLDFYGAAIFSGDVASVKDDFTSRVARLLAASDSEDDARKAAAQEIYQLTWGPTRVPVYDLILLGTLAIPDRRAQILEAARFLISEANVSVVGVDLSGSQAIYHCISTKPAFDPELAQMLYDAGADVNLRNRYGGTPAHEITQVYDVVNPESMQRSADALKWFLDHGGNVDMKDNDGAAARGSVESMRRSARVARSGVRLPMWAVLDQEDRRRQRLVDSICAFCGRDDITPKRCSQCTNALYCPKPRKCQKLDWPRHKVSCQVSRV
ncbi:hypothetical protein DAEQUDRAFT_730189 [Daedalea quercina L-15889]|uniref:MYND-type domain-containing protein n=1 Tax=Daedalea quercina L-15889 TaxID=1314783 RepID=A0A165N426_9APHY|nr:hypothetical protein DAEQUDRAFT_730189 [Daedalea quercina L-15889]